MDVVVTGRHCEITERYREHVEEKLSRLEKHDHRIMRVAVELDCEANPRQRDRAVRLELTAFSKGPVIRAEACAVDKMAALDLALDKMAAQMRRAADRRRVHRGGRHAPVSVGRVLSIDDGLVPEAPPARRAAGAPEDPSTQLTGSLEVSGDGPLVVREKSHAAQPMGLDQALYEMELVGHDFYLYVDHDTRRPSVVYRRRGYDYGVITLDVGAGV